MVIGYVRVSTEEQNLTCNATHLSGAAPRAFSRTSSVLCCRYANLGQRRRCQFAVHKPTPGDYARGRFGLETFE
jgi:hypothetical protein